MKQIAKGELNTIKTADLIASLPFEITSNGEVIAVVSATGTVPAAASQQVAEEDVGKFKTKCPNCGLVYQGIKPDNKPGFLSMH